VPVQQEGSFKAWKAALVALGAIGGPEVIDAFIETLQEKEVLKYPAKTAAACVNALQKEDLVARAQDVIPFLVDLTSRFFPDWCEIDITRLWGLMRDLARPAVPALLKVEATHCPWDRRLSRARRALDAILQNEGEAIACYIGALRSSDHWVRIGATYQLGDRGALVQGLIPYLLDCVLASPPSESEIETRAISEALKRIDPEMNLVALAIEAMIQGVNPEGDHARTRLLNLAQLLLP